MADIAVAAPSTPPVASGDDLVEIEWVEGDDSWWLVNGVWYSYKGDVAKVAHRKRKKTFAAKSTEKVAKKD